MSTIEPKHESVRRGRTGSPAAWALLAGGVSFFVGGSMHPSEDPPDLTLEEHLLLLYENASWYPSHAFLLAGMVLIAASLVALVRGKKTLVSAPRAQRTGAVAAIAAVAGAAASLLHLVAATEADRIAAGERTPLTDVSLVVETLINPAVGLSIAALAVIGALTRTIGYRLTAVFGLVGGFAYALAGGTVLFTDKLNFLFPFSAGIAVWAVAAAVRLLLEDRANATAGSRVAYDESP